MSENNATLTRYKNLTQHKEQMLSVTFDGVLGVVNDKRTRQINENKIWKIVVNRNCMIWTCRNE